MKRRAKKGRRCGSMDGRKLLPVGGAEHKSDYLCGHRLARSRRQFLLIKKRNQSSSSTVVPVASDNKSKLYLEQQTPFLRSTFSSLATEHSPVKRRRKINITIYLIMVYYAIVCCHPSAQEGATKRKINY